MRGQKTFTITSKFVGIIFYLVILTCVINVVIRTYRLFEGDANLAGTWHQDPLSFDVMSFGHLNPSTQFPYRYSEGKLAALRQPPDHYQLLVGHRSPIGYYDYFLSILLTGAVLYGMWELRSIFRSISIKEPFAASNARRIRNIGLLLIGVDIVKIINYIIFDFMANKYFSGAELLIQIGNGIWVGSLLLALSVVYRRGVEIYSDNQLTI
ncbi:DUF2975 domain-containing protein [Chitinophaga oryziterrae]|uniref:DUF2975 domain-containing protein n=1 Tax=Chitinophaga oryziterrae TaxID=1031224 RepID=A0A6N8JGS2_9BACT|nr:DUF2975 domain-containing protein [Chitinophaga oryziterrae]MVT43536.1 DUF2975 domain-containing protein [Chitinophaga oryziterrae]